MYFIYIYTYDLLSQILDFLDLCTFVAKVWHNLQTFPPIFVSWKVDFPFLRCFAFWLEEYDSPLWTFLKYDLYDTLTISSYSSWLNLSFTEMQTISLKIAMISIFALGYYVRNSEGGKPSCAKPISEMVIFLQEKFFFYQHFLNYHCMTTMKRIHNSREVNLFAIWLLHQEMAENRARQWFSQLADESHQGNPVFHISLKKRAQWEFFCFMFHKLIFPQVNLSTS